MLELNRTLIQLNRAVEFANSDLPQEKGRAIILFDNLVEILLYKKIENVFWSDMTSWDKKRLYSEKKRIATFKFYDKLLVFSKEKNFISNEDFELLRYVHKIRNDVYHYGELDDFKLELAIYIYYDFFIRNIIELNNLNGSFYIVAKSGYDRIDFGQGLDECEFIFEDKKYFEKAINFILSKINIDASINDKVKDFLSNKIKHIEDSINFINNEIKAINFYRVLGFFYGYLNDNFYYYFKIGRRPKNLNSILLTYAFLNKYKAYLDDIGNLIQRQFEGRKLYNKFRSQFKGEYPYWINLNKIKKRIRKINNENLYVILKILVDIENKIFHLYEDVLEAASDLDGYVQMLVDDALGK